MIGGEHDGRVVVALRLFQLVDQTTDHQVRGGGVDLQEQEVALARLRLDPAVCRVERRRTRTLRQHAFFERLVRNLGVVVGKALRDARRTTQQKRRDGGTSAEAAIAQQGGKRSRLILQRIATIVANAVVKRQLAGDERRVRRKCQR